MAQTPGDLDDAPLNEFYKSPSNIKEKLACEYKSAHEASGQKDELGKRIDESDSSSDSDYMPGDACASEEDEEASDILKKFKAFKMKLRMGQVATLDDVQLDSYAPKMEDNEMMDSEEGTPYADSDDDQSVEEMGSDGELRKKYCRRFKSGVEVPRFELGMKFSGRKEFKDAIIKYFLREKKVVNFIKDEPTRVRAKCDWPHCPWVCLCSKNARTASWQVATFRDEHTCPLRRDNKHVTGRRIAAKYEKFMMANPSWSFAQMKNTVQEEMFADVSIPKLKRARTILKQKVYDSTKGQYERLYDYQLELLRSNPGSTVVVNEKPDMEPPTFWRMYICLDACKKGIMAGCRKVVGLDGCSFKGATNGELLQAIGRDANNQMYPIAWAVVDKENNKNWDWFCDLLFRDLQVGDGKDWVFISDQQNGILDAVVKWAPKAEHRSCARCIYANWKKEFFVKEWQKKFWACAKAPCVVLFDQARAKLAQDTREGAQAILNTHPQHWSRAWFRLGNNCDSVDNNLCESFNKWIVEAKLFPIITILEAIRRKVMVRIQEQRAKAERWTSRICPNILKKLNAYVKQSECCHAISNGADKFEVKHFEHSFIVDLEAKTCSCRYWQLSGLPCCHAISSIHFKKNAIEDYIADCYAVEQFKKTYSHCVEPIEGQESWPISERPKLQGPDPFPGYIRMRGRPKKERTREPTEKPKASKTSRVGTVIRCNKCKGVGHNRSTCDRRNGTAGPSAAAVAPSGGAPSIAAPSGPAQIHLSGIQQSINSGKRKVSMTLGNQDSIGTNSSSKQATRKAPMPILFLPPWDTAKL